MQKEIFIPQWRGMGEEGELWFIWSHGRPGQWGIWAGWPLLLEPDGGRHTSGVPRPLRDDDLGDTDLHGPALDRLRKEIIKVFQKNVLRITIERGKNFLNITLNLQNDSFRPFRKDRTPTNPHITRMSSRRWLARGSLNYPAAERFLRLRPLYTTPPSRTLGTGRDCRQWQQDQTYVARKRTITWFNPPWNDTVATKVASKFLQLLKILKMHLFIKSLIEKQLK